MDQVIHVISPYAGEGDLARRQALFLQSSDQAQRGNVIRLAVTGSSWRHPGWQVQPVFRTAESLGDASDKPFIKDLYDLALEYAQPDD